jgi:hypothetical protein
MLAWFSVRVARDGTPAAYHRLDWTTARVRSQAFTGLLGRYSAFTPGVCGAVRPSVRLPGDNKPQPDTLLKSRSPTTLLG